MRTKPWLPKWFGKTNTQQHLPGDITNIQTHSSINVMEQFMTCFLGSIISCICQLADHRAATVTRTLLHKAPRYLRHRRPSGLSKPREREYLCVCVWDRVCVCERESLCVCVCVWARERERVCVTKHVYRNRQLIWTHNWLSSTTVFHTQAWVSKPMCIDRWIVTVHKKHG